MTGNTTEEEELKELMRLRILEEQKIMESTKQRRKLKQRQLIGSNTEGIRERRGHIEDAKRLWSAKGTTEDDKQAQLQSYGTTTIDASVVSKAKNQYEENLQLNKDKGKSEDHLYAAEEEEVPELDDLKEKHDTQKSKLPALFSKKTKEQPETPVVEKDKTAGMSTGFGDDFETIEKEEVTMVGLEKHVKVTGISKAGRRVTRTKIILPKMVGKTIEQSQYANKKDCGEANNPLLPDNFDGMYYSLHEIQQRDIPDYNRVIDRNNREQYLSPKEFEKEFGTTKEEFAKLPKWKRVNMKRTLHLY
jgi:hypothetical protein